MFAAGIRERSVVLLFIYNIDIEVVSILMGPSVRTLKRWLLEFENSGNLSGSGWKPRAFAPDKLLWIEDYIKTNPCFYLEEMQQSYLEHFAQTISQSTLCRVIRRDTTIVREI